MVDSSWDNSGRPREREGLPLWGKIGIGCGAVLVLAMGTCVAGAAYLSHRGPAFERQVQGWVAKSMAEEWTLCRTTVDRLLTDEGARALYRENPALAEAHPTEEAFLEAVRGWRPRLDPLPEAIPFDSHSHDLRIHKDLGGSLHVRYRNAKGGTLFLDLEHGRIRSLDVR